MTIEPTSYFDDSANTTRWKGSFICLPREFIRDDAKAYARLNGNAVKLLVALITGYVGNNNGELIATFPVMKTYGFNSKDSIAKALSELMNARVIIRTRVATYRLPATYAVTWLPVNKAKKGRPYDNGVESTHTSADLWRSPSKPGASSAAPTPTPTPAPAPAPSTAAVAAPAPSDAPAAVVTRAPVRCDEPGSKLSHESSGQPASRGPATEEKWRREQLDKALASPGFLAYRQRKAAEEARKAKEEAAA